MAKTPWSDLQKKLEPTRGPYSEYDAFCKWFAAQNEVCDQINADVGAADMIWVYEAFMKAFYERDSG